MDFGLALSPGHTTGSSRHINYIYTTVHAMEKNTQSTLMRGTTKVHHAEIYNTDLLVRYKISQPFFLLQSTPFFNCSRVKKIKIVVGWRRVQAGTQPLNMNIAPSDCIEERMTASVD